MHIHLPYGKTTISASIPDGLHVDVIEPPAVPPASDQRDAVREALENLLGGVRWEDFRGAKTAAIAVNDKTRPVPHDRLLPPLLAKLKQLGIPEKAITFYVAVGTHPPMTIDEFPSILPAEILARYRVISHDSEDGGWLVDLGTTPNGTPVWANKAFCQADLKIVVGNIEPHQFVGFSGGVKTAAVGLAGLESINHNHALLTDPASRIGEYETNPARQDVEAMGEMIGIHIALNAVLNQDRQIVHVLAGDPRAVMQSGIPLSRQVCQVGVSAEYDVLISSPGGYPKDINVYQAQKGLAHAALITRPGGTIILAAACTEGSGSPHYEDWMTGKRSFSHVFSCFQSEGFRVGPHKAYLIARDAAKARLLMCSEMDETLARKLLLYPQFDLQSAVDTALQGLPDDSRIGVLPHASSTIPFIKG
jgi:lactate racemase